MQSVLPTAATFAPFAPMAMAVARPMPLLAPVTIAILPFSIFPPFRNSGLFYH